MLIQHFLLGPLQTNCYVVADGESPEAMIVDAGGDPAEAVDYIEAHGLKPSILLNTHCHADHIAGNTALKERYPDIQITIHELDADSIGKPLKNLSFLMGTNYRSPAADVRLNEGDTVTVGRCAFDVILVPGHTPGGMCLYAASPPGTDAPILIDGDALFAGGVGRGDFPGGDLDLLIRTIKEKLLVLPDETVVYPGHGPATTIGDEKRTNPYVA